jgi:hypothetical protein
MNERRSWTFAALGAMAILVVLAFVIPDAHAATHVKKSLRSTGVDPDASGSALVIIRRKGTGMAGAMKVKGRNLNSNSTYGISVAGVRIGTLTTNVAGSGTARFSSQPRGSTQSLGVDPSGKLLEVSDEQGEDVLETDMPDDTEPGDIRCCLPDDDGSECEETTPDECMAENGTNMGAGSCFPSPCPTTPPSPDIQCCLPDEDGPECEEESAEECSAEHGVNMGTGSCEPNPCASAPPPGIVSCCISQGDQGEQEGEPQTEPPECERLTVAECSDEGGVATTAASCAPNPCVASPSGAFLN